MRIITIGRDNSCDIVISDLHVSRLHAEVEYVIESERCYYLFADKSSNGTLINGHFIKNDSMKVYESFPLINKLPLEPQILLARTVPLPWEKIMAAFSVTTISYNRNDTVFSENKKVNMLTGGLPANINRWNWGAFFFTWLWALCNRIYWPLILLIPCIGTVAFPVVAIILGLKGNEWAWENGQWNDSDRFRKVQEGWATAALWTFVIFIILLCIYVVVLCSMSF